MPRVRVQVGDDELERELDRLGGPPVELFARMETVLAEQFAATQATVHIDTGSLRNSGDIDSTNTDTGWEGTITYGGPSPGYVNDPVDYAAFEAGRGGHHNFIAPALGMSRRYGAAIAAWLAGGAAGGGVR